MKPKDRNLLIAGVVICMVIAILAPFIASTNPDGLEKSAQQISTTEESGNYHAPFADYTISILGDSPLAGIAALAIGVIIALGLGYIVAVILRRKNQTERSK